MKQLLLSILLLCSLDIPAQDVLVTRHSKGMDNGHEWVDLGLSVKWATCNVGANSPQEFGSFFAWAESKPKNSFYWKNYFDSLDSQGKKFRYYYNNGGKTHIETWECTDAARQIWGGGWRTPSYAEMQELVKKCTWTQKTINGVKGYEVKGPNGNSIFLPATGWRWGTKHAFQGVGADYWTNAIDSKNSRLAHNLHFEGTVIGIYSIERYMGRVIRPVVK